MAERILSYRYPKGPENFDGRILEPSREFRKEVKGVLGSILFFIVTYLFLVVAGIALSGLCALLGFWVITSITNIWAIVFGVGLVGLGIMVVYFLFKFVFKSNKVDRTNMVTITRKQQPVLFDFLERLARETHTPLPKRVYLSPEANASVFYDSGFWSMFLPVRKNLNIGLALVNTLNVSELKAVIAHEFGHFSQRSMKLGSYVYNVNHILYDMLYDNDGYEDTLESWGSVSNIFAFFADLTRVIVHVIQKILRSIYSRINVQYMALSRQMELHADAVAASVSGSSSLIHALCKLDIADTCYRDVISVCDGWVQENRKSKNIYPQQSIAIRDYATFHALALGDNNLIRVSAEDFKKFNRTRVVIKDQWASHPDLEDRAKHMANLELDAEVVADAAWTLFMDPEKLQEEVTGVLYSKVSFSKDPQVVDNETFAALFASQAEKYRFNEAYRGFYDNREITGFDPEAIEQNPSASSLGDILSGENLLLPSMIQGLKADIEALEAIQPKSSGVTTFDFEGRRHDREEAGELIVKLKEELKDASAKLDHADKEMFRLFRKKSRDLGKETEAIVMYGDLFMLTNKANADIKKVNAMIREASQLFGENVTRDMATVVGNNMVRERVATKELMKRMLEDESFARYYTEDEKQILLKFMEDMRPYFFNVGFDSEAINLYMEALFIYGRIISERTFDQKKKTLDLQLKVIQEHPAYV